MHWENVFFAAFLSLVRRVAFYCTRAVAACVFFYLCSIRNWPLNASWRCQCFPFLFSSSKLGLKSSLSEKINHLWCLKGFRNTLVFQNARNAVSNVLVPLSTTPWSRLKPLPCSRSVFSLDWLIDWLIDSFIHSFLFEYGNSISYITSLHESRIEKIKQ